MLFGLLPGTTRAEQTQTAPIADTPAAETLSEAVHAHIPTINQDTHGNLYAIDSALNETRSTQIMVYSYYDSSCTTTMRNNIDEAIAFVNSAFQYSGYSSSFKSVYSNVYLDTFYRRNNDEYDSGYDDCPYTENCEPNMFTCGMACINHHKNVHRISEALNSMNTGNSLQILWTDRPSDYFCMERNEYDPTHTTIGYQTLAVVCKDEVNGEWVPRQVVHLLNIPDTETTNAEIRACMAINLAHEIAHTLGFTGEAYSSSSHENASGWCVMKRFSTDTSEQMYTDILTGTKRGFCSSCISNLTAALS